MANAPYPFPAVPYAATYCYPPPASAHAPPPGFFPAPPYAFPYPAPPAPGCFSAPAYGPPPPAYHYGPDPAPVFPNPYYQFHSPPPEWPSPPTPTLSPTGDPANSAMPATTLPILAESSSPTFLTTTSKMQAAPTPMLELQEPNGASSSSRDLHHSSFGGPILSQPPPAGAAPGSAEEKAASTSRRTPTPTTSSNPRRHPAPPAPAPSPLARNPASPAATPTLPYAAHVSTPPSAQSWAASSPNQGLVPVRFSQLLSAEPAATTPVRRPDRVPSTPISCSRSSTLSWLLDAIPTTPNQERRPPRCHASSTPALHPIFPTNDEPNWPSHAPDPTPSTLPAISTPVLLESAEAAREEATISEHMSQAQSSFASLQAELSKLRYRLSSLATSMVPSSASSTSTTERITSVPATSASSVPAAPAYVAPQVFAEMATPNSEQETQGTTSNFCSRQLNPIQMSCVSNLNEQNLDEMPQPYGFHSLDRHSVFLADGTECSYYALPEDYPLERVVLEPMCDFYDDETEGCSNAFVHASGSNPEQQPYKEEQQDSEQLLKYVGKAPETEQKIACLSYSAHLLDYTLELQQQDDENAPINVLQPTVPQLSVLVIHKRRKEWDPGVHVIPHSCTATHPGDCTHRLLVLYMSCREIRDNCFTDLKLMTKTSSKVAAFTWHGSLPGTPFILMSSTTCTWDPGILCIRDRRLDKYIVSPQVQLVQLIAELAIPSLTTCIQYMATSGSNSVPQVTPFNLQRDAHFSQGILNQMGIMLEETTVANPVHTMRTPFKLFNTVEKSIDLNQFGAHFLCQCHSWYITHIVFLQGLHIHLILPVNRPHLCACYQITNWTSTTSNVIRSFAYGYIMDFLIGQWELTHQQGVHEYYRTKCLLLSSKEYLKIWELDTVFITFLPP